MNHPLQTTDHTPPASPDALRYRGHHNARPLLAHLPLLLTLGIVLAMLWHGPIAQPAHYHAFADNTWWADVPHAGDVISNLGFALVAVWGGWHLAPRRAAIGAAWFGYRLFLVALLLTAVGSTFYHLAPDNFRLLWDRLPIALACAGLLAAARAENGIGGIGGDARSEAALLALAAVLSVAWWHFTGPEGSGDLRPYLLLQLLPIVLIPLWQAIHRSERRDRLLFAAAVLAYVAAKAAELNDHQLLAASALVSGHTLKHLLAALASALIVVRPVLRLRARLRAG